VPHVLSLGEDTEDDLSPEITVKSIGLLDKIDTKIEDYLEEAFEFINEGTKLNNRILIHCYLGRSRSPAVTIIYLHHCKNLSMASAYFYVATRRPQMGLNHAFQNYIIDWCKR
ncbi:phosphatases II, partial [Fomitiporia mediterranea MF3/22]|uniref:phosphatases II n=1 Tax=Fomitiporia mediterranea (strain MF3/22) TaxID=694068 RepID=UPI00044072CA